MPEDIYFHARRSKSSRGGSVSLEIWKGLYRLGIWELPAQQAWDLSAELIAHMSEAPPETEHSRCVRTVNGFQCRRLSGHMGNCKPGLDKQ